MKSLKLILITLSVILLQGCASYYTEIITQPQEMIVDVGGESKEDLYIRANTWMVETFSNASSVIQFSDKENGIITGKYLMKEIVTSTTTSEYVYSNIKIQVRDGSTKITITPNPYYNRGNVMAGGEKYPKEKLIFDIEKLMEDFGNKIIHVENDDW